MSSNDKQRRSPNARLQDCIVLDPGRHDDVEAVAKPGRGRGTSRASTSRAINRLKGEGLVQKIEGRWSLTEEGTAEEVRLRRRLPERSKQAKREIDRIARLQKDYEGLVPDFSALAPDLSALAPDLTALAPDLAALAPDFSALATSLFRMEDYQVRPFFEAVNLVDSIGVGSPSISSSLETISESVRTNLTDHMKSIAESSIADSLTSAKVESLSGMLNLLNAKLGEGGFASLQVRAVEDLFRRIPSSTIPSDPFKALMPQVDLATGTMVRQILEQADLGALLGRHDASPETSASPKGGPSASLDDAPSASPEDGPSALLGDAPSSHSGEAVGSSELPAQDPDEIAFGRDWDDLSEVMKLRIVAAATFIILHVALSAAQDQKDDSAFVKDLIIALGGTGAVVATCKQLELIKEED